MLKDWPHSPLLIGHHFSNSIVDKARQTILYEIQLLVKFINIIALEGHFEQTQKVVLQTNHCVEIMKFFFKPKKILFKPKKETTSTISENLPKTDNVTSVLKEISDEKHFRFDMVGKWKATWNG